MRKAVARSTKRRPMAEINVVPYIDVMLVLLIIFMITAPLIQQGVEIDLPQADAEQVDDDNIQPLVVTVDQQGQYYLDVGEKTDEPISTDTLQIKVAAVLRNKPKTSVMIRGDKGVLYGEVVRAMTSLQAAGVPSIGLLTDPNQ
ncbi:protein TolR [Cycloclasticus pugetii]|uniref:protein TolR n=1 Tax=Cycloclasticus pugetii TaxID=34068 RepID=UPI00091FC338|nr:protein TolR [Cycloclasticus pugetii]SHI88578.1 Cell division and transport-associated protein TolR [Cycloclasticus pugetii]